MLVAVDGSDNGARAAKVAVALAKKFGAELIVCHVIPTPTYSSVQAGTFGAGNVLHEYFESARKEAKGIVDQVVKLAEDRGVDLIVIGTRGLSGFRKLLMGSVSLGVINHAHCSVLLVR